jgi:hypothetical protein
LLLKDFRVPYIDQFFLGIGVSIGLDIFAVGNTKAKVVICALIAFFVIFNSVWGAFQIYIHRISDPISEEGPGITSGYTVLSHPRYASLSFFVKS